MDWNQTKTRAAAWGIALLIAALALFTIGYFWNYLHPYANRTLTDLSDGWSFRTGSDPTARTLDYLTKVTGVAPGETLYLTRTLDGEGDLLMVKYYYQTLSVSLNGEQIFTSPVPDGRNPGAGLAFLPVSAGDKGTALQLSLTSPYPTYAGFASPVYLGDAPSLMAKLFSDALPHLFFLLVCTLIGFFFLFYSSLSIFRGKRQWNSFFFGLFSVLLGFFCVSRDDIIYLVFPPIPASLLGILLHTVYLIPLMAYFYCYFTTHKRLVRCILVVLCLNAAAVFLIQASGAADLPDMLPVINLVVSLSFLPIIGIVLYELVHGNRVIRFLFPIIILVIVFSAGTVLYYYDSRKPSISMYLNAVFLLVISIWIYHLREFVYQRVAEKKELQALQFQIERTRKDYEAIAAHMKEIRMMRHEIGHHIAALQILNGQGESGRLAKYLDTIAEQVSQSTALYSENLLVNCILSDRAGRAKEARIPIETDIGVPASLPIADPDLCSLLTNLLDNAIESNLRLDAESRWLRIQIRLKGNFLVIACANACAPAPGMPLRSSKEGDHGYGIAIMRSIAKKYESTLEMERQARSFCVKTALQLPMEPADAVSQARNGR